MKVIIEGTIKEDFPSYNEYPQLAITASIRKRLDLKPTDEVILRIK